MTDVLIGIFLLGVVMVALSGAKKRIRGGCCGGGDGVKLKPKDKNRAHYSEKAIVYINGMTCEHCKTAVENAFCETSGCMAKVNLKKKCAVVWSKTYLSDERLAEIVNNRGYEFVRCERV